MTKDEMQFLALIAASQSVRQAILDAFGIGPTINKEK